ncbi:Cenp-O kinetochore centromere component-domain-containing protein [Podospora australis]|uniref:Cenp-O kinetochore centromere component-domain-containing protein n=1 Tax=Podospora australis TaxID=1536484 RepID=A0AAN6WSJ8_9PEZI|nr:Cenp-O kinetochore centromere component-domain-containing protein [Podospora australis]
MSTSPPPQSPPSLDEEIESLQTRITHLKKQLQLHTSTLLTAPSTRQLLLSSASSSSAAPLLLTLPSTSSTASTSSPADQKAFKETLLAKSNSQQAHHQATLYRACATLTTFRATDPDPNAVDSGRILGLRIEVVSRAKFLRPYYVFFNRPFASLHKNFLRVHRHTVPQCIPLAGLANRYLPAPSSGRKQDLAKFARQLRREVVRYHHRLGVVANLRKGAGIGKQEAEGTEEEEEDKPVDISVADAEAKQVTIEWADGRTGRLVIGDDGEVVDFVVVAEDGGRDRDAGRGLLGGGRKGPVEEVVSRLASG